MLLVLTISFLTAIFFSHTLLLTFFAYHSGVKQTNFAVRMEISVLTKHIPDRILPHHSQMWSAAIAEGVCLVWKEKQNGVYIPMWALWNEARWPLRKCDLGMSQPRWNQPLIVLMKASKTSARSSIYSSASYSKITYNSLSTYQTTTLKQFMIR